MNMTKEEWIERAVKAGAPTNDYADSLYLAYTDDGESDMSPEQIVADDAAILIKGGRAV